MCAVLLNAAGAAHAILPFENTGNLYVSMWNADDIAVFTPDGALVEKFSADGLDGPRGIAFNPANGEIWIAGEFSNAIHIFDYNHQLLRTLEHPEFNEPVGVTFSMQRGVAVEDQLVYISNSNGNELMVFNQQGELQRRFSAPELQDPNCSAFMDDGTLFVANRLGGTTGSIGAVNKFGANDEFLFDFTTDGIQSLMAIARDPNSMPGGFDDTIWVTSGGGDRGIYEFDQNGNLLTTMLPAAIDDGSAIVPQGIAFDKNGDFYVVSFFNEVIKFDGNGNFLMRFPTGSGTSRSTAFQACQPGTNFQNCVPPGVSMANEGTGSNEVIAGEENSAQNNTDGSVDISATDSTMTAIQTNSRSGGGSKSLYILISLFVLFLYRRSTRTS